MIGTKKKEKEKVELRKKLKRKNNRIPLNKWPI